MTDPSAVQHVNDILNLYFRRDVDAAERRLKELAERNYSHDVSARLLLDLVGSKAPLRVAVLPLLLEELGTAPTVADALERLGGRISLNDLHSAADTAFRLAAAIDGLDPRNREPWGGPFNGQENHQRLFRAIISNLNIGAIIETGTFRGSTTEYMARVQQIPVLSCEINPRYFYYSQDRLRSCPNAAVALQDSRSFLTSVLSDDRMRGRSFFYLDTHWTGDLSLREEIDIVLQRAPDPIIMIDDSALPGDLIHYGPGKGLRFEYLTHLAERELCYFFPTLAAGREGGAKRGCIVICRSSSSEDLAAGVDGLFQLTWDQAMLSGSLGWVLMQHRSLLSKTGERMANFGEEDRKQTAQFAKLTSDEIAAIPAGPDKLVLEIAKLAKDQRLIEEKHRQIEIVAAERDGLAAQIAGLQRQYAEENEVLRSRIRKLIKSRWHRLGRRLGLVKSYKNRREKPSVGKGTIDALVGRIYELALHRRSSPEERRSWVGKVLDGEMSIAAMVEAISMSPEAAAARNILPDLSNGRFVQLAYEWLLDRGAMADEIVRWDHNLCHRKFDRSRLLNVLFTQGVALRAATQRNNPARTQLLGTDEIISGAKWQERKAAVKDAAPAPAKTYPSLALPRQSGILISAIASLYRGGEFIEQFLQNITSQTLFRSCCELVIVDASSPENEFAAIAPYMERFPNVVYHRTPTRISVYEAWNLGIGKARGKYVTNTNVDDLRRPDSFERQAEILEKFPFVDIVYQDYYCSFDGSASFDLVAAINARSNTPIITPYNLMRLNSPHNAPMWRRALHRDVGLFDESYRSAGDNEFWLRCVRAGKVFYKINDPHVVYFVNPEGVSTQPDTLGFQEANRATRQHARELVSSNLVSSDDDFLAEISNILQAPLDLSEPERSLREWRFVAVQRALRLCSIASRRQPSKAMSSG